MLHLELVTLIKQICVHLFVFVYLVGGSSLVLSTPWSTAAVTANAHVIEGRH